MYYGWKRNGKDSFRTVAALTRFRSVETGGVVRAGVNVREAAPARFAETGSGPVHISPLAVLATGGGPIRALKPYPVATVGVSGMITACQYRSERHRRHAGPGEEWTSCSAHRA